MWCGVVWCSVESVRVRVREVGWGGEGRGLFVYVGMYKVCISFRGTYAILVYMILFFIFIFFNVVPSPRMVSM